jgi:hypothetical protein
MDFIVEELVGPETSSSKFRDYCHSRRSNRDAYCFRCLPDCFPIRYQGSIHRGYSMPSPFGQRTGYGPAYFRKMNFRSEYRQSRICCYLQLFGLLGHSSKARFQACQSSMRYWSHYAGKSIIVPDQSCLNADPESTENNTSHQPTRG